VRLVFLTGVRIGEALGARCSEFDAEKQTWLIPGVRSGRKNGEDLLLRLSPQALALLERLPRNGDFGSPRHGGMKTTRDTRGGSKRGVSLRG
jgi:integrase